MADTETTNVLLMLANFQLSVIMACAILIVIQTLSGRR